MPKITKTHIENQNEKMLSLTKSRFANRRIQSLYKLFENNEGTDAHFVFTENGQTKCISAHKTVLAAESPVFKAMFYGALKEQAEIKMVDELSATFMVFLQAIYHKFDTINVENIGEVMLLADKYDTKDVMDYCIEFLYHEINVQMVCLVLKLALRYCQLSLLSSCNLFISIKWKEVLDSESFLDIDCTTLQYMVANISVMSRNEKGTFDACIKWARNSCEGKLIDITPGNLRAEPMF